MGDVSRSDKHLAAYADNRDPVEVAEEWVAVALQGRPWEARDCDGEGPCFIERGTARNGDCERFISSPLTDLDAAIIERLLEVARGPYDVGRATADASPKEIEIIG